MNDEISLPVLVGKGVEQPPRNDPCVDRCTRLEKRLGEQPSALAWDARKNASWHTRGATRRWWPRLRTRNTPELIGVTGSSATRKSTSFARKSSKHLSGIRDHRVRVHPHEPLAGWMVNEIMLNQHDLAPVRVAPQIQRGTRHDGRVTVPFRIGPHCLRCEPAELGDFRRVQGRDRHRPFAFGPRLGRLVHTVRCGHANFERDRAMRLIDRGCRVVGKSAVPAYVRGDPIRREDKFLGRAKNRPIPGNLAPATVRQFLAHRCSRKKLRFAQEPRRLGQPVPALALQRQRGAGRRLLILPWRNGARLAKLYGSA